MILNKIKMCRKAYPPIPKDWCDGEHPQVRWVQLWPGIVVLGAILLLLISKFV